MVITAQLTAPKDEKNALYYSTWTAKNRGNKVPVCYMFHMFVLKNIWILMKNTEVHQSCEFCAVNALTELLSNTQHSRDWQMSTHTQTTVSSVHCSLSY